MGGIREIAERQRRWQEERPQGGGNMLYPREGDVVLAHFVSTGEEGDPYWEAFYSHELPATRQGGFSDLIYCPVESGFDDSYHCQFCLEGVKVKKRMMIWFWVYCILHDQLRQGEQYPVVTHNGKTYYKQDVNDVRMWDTSAWKESPLDDILFIGGQMPHLNDVMIQLLAVGNGLDRRYKLHTMVGSTPIEPATLEEARKRARPIIEILNEQITPTATAERPTAEVTQPLGIPTAGPIPTTPVGAPPIANPSPLPFPPGRAAGGIPEKLF